METIGMLILFTAIPVIYIIYIDKKQSEPTNKTESQLQIHGLKNGIVRYNHKKNIKNINATPNEQCCCSNCNSIINVQVHHIIPIQFGGTDDKNNLIYLCRDCHEAEHNYQFKEEINTSKERTPKEKYKIIIKAIKNNQRLEIKYFSPSYWEKKAETTKRVIMPKKLYKAPYVSKSGKAGFHMTLKAHCYLREEERNFQVRRIKGIKLVN